MATRTSVSRQMSKVCCGSPRDIPLSELEARDLAAVFAALADPVRLRLFSLVSSSTDGGVCACDLVTTLGKAQPTVSHHLKILFEAGLLEREKRGVWVWYRAAPGRVLEVASKLH